MLVQVLPCFLERKRWRRIEMPELFLCVNGIENIEEIFDRMINNCRNPCSTSKKLWQLRQDCDICDRNYSPEKMLEKTVAILAKQGHMKGWFNQCPTASGITDASESRRDSFAKGKGRNIDLVYRPESSDRVRFVELKWETKKDDPNSALWQIVRYGIAYVFCRIHKDKLPVTDRPLMSARHVGLEVAAPRQFYMGHDEKERFTRVSESLDEFARIKTGGALSMSLSALSFPENFDEVPFANGQDVKEKCFTQELSNEGRMVRDSFAGLTPVWPRS